MNNVRRGHFEHIDFDKLGDVPGQALKFDFHQQMLDDAPFDLHAMALVFVDEVQRHVDFHRLVGVDAQKIRVHDAIPGGMAL